MRWILPLLLALCPWAIYTAEPAAETVQAASTSNPPMWVTAVASIIIFVLTWLTKKFSTSVNAKVEATKIDANRSLIEQKHALLERVKLTAIRVANGYVENEMLPVIVDALDGGGFDTKKHVQAAYKAIFKEVKSVFAEEGINLLAMFGKQRIVGMIQAAAHGAINSLPQKYAKFLPKPIVDKLVGFISDFILTKTSDWLTDAITDDD